jgi:hypothetical protein
MSAFTDYAIGVSSYGADTWLACGFLCRNCITVVDEKRLHKTSLTYHAGICWTLCRRKSLNPVLERQVLETWRQTVPYFETLRYNPVVTLNTALDTGIKASVVCESQLCALRTAIWKNNEFCVSLDFQYNQQLCSTTFTHCFQEHGWSKRRELNSNSAFKYCICRLAV